MAILSLPARAICFNGFVPFYTIRNQKLKSDPMQMPDCIDVWEAMQKWVFCSSLKRQIRLHIYIVVLFLCSTCLENVYYLTKHRRHRKENVRTYLGWQTHYTRTQHPVFLRRTLYYWFGLYCMYCIMYCILQCSRSSLHECNYSIPQKI